jgi:hypothetical protein
MSGTLENGALIKKVKEKLKKVAWNDGLCHFFIVSLQTI